MRVASPILLLCLWLAPSAGAAESPGRSRAALVTVEGTVLAVETLLAEGDLPVVALRLQTDRSELGELTLLLGPGEALADIGFEVETGDMLRAKIFLEAEGPAKVHKTLNLTRGTMVRLRTLHKVPLWSGSGHWQGGPAGRQAGAAGRGVRKQAGRGPGGH